MVEKFKEYDVGISVFKIYLVMAIVVCHFLNTEIPNPWNILFTSVGNFAVPALVFISFSYLNIKDSVFKRLKRLVLPHIFFSIISFALYYLGINSTLTSLVMNEVTWKDFLSQILFGASTNPPMWFFVNLIYLTLILSFVYKIKSKSLKFIILNLMLMIAIWLQYSGRNLFIFENLPSYIKWSTGRIVELLPIAIIGTFFSEFNLLEKVKRNWQYSLIISICIIFVDHYCYVFKDINGFGYQGMRMIIVPLFMTILIYSLPLCKLGFNHAKYLHNIAKYGVGIIGFHYLVCSVYIQIFGRRGDTLLFGLLIYSISFFITLVITLIPFKIFSKFVT